jgi:hypothetical protein
MRRRRARVVIDLGIGFEQGDRVTLLCARQGGNDADGTSAGDDDAGFFILNRPKSLLHSTASNSLNVSTNQRRSDVQYEHVSGAGDHSWVRDDAGMSRVGTTDSAIFF